MAQFGKSTSMYIQNELLMQINEAIKQAKEPYKSKSHFINCAIVREIRRIKEHANAS